MHAHCPVPIAQMILLVSLVAPILSRSHDDALEWLYLMNDMRVAPVIVKAFWRLVTRAAVANNVNLVNTEVLTVMMYVEGTIA